MFDEEWDSYIASKSFPQIPNISLLQRKKEYLYMEKPGRHHLNQVLKVHITSDNLKSCATDRMQ